MGCQNEVKQGQGNFMEMTWQEESMGGRKENLRCQYRFTEGFPVSTRRNVSTTDLAVSRWWQDEVRSAWEASRTPAVKTSCCQYRWCQADNYFVHCGLSRALFLLRYFEFSTRYENSHSKIKASKLFLLSVRMPGASIPASELQWSWHSAALGSGHYLLRAESRGTELLLCLASFHFSLHALPSK